MAGEFAASKKNVKRRAGRDERLRKSIALGCEGGGERNLGNGRVGQEYKTKRRYRKGKKANAGRYSPGPRYILPSLRPPSATNSEGTNYST